MNEDELLDALTGGEAELRAGFAEVVAHLRSTNDLDTIERMVVEGRLEDALEGVEQAAQHIASRVEAAFTRGALDEARAVASQGSALRPLTYDVSNDVTVTRMRVNALRVADGFSAEAQTTAREAMARGLAAGRNPRAIARDIRGSIGLSAKQEQIVDNYRRQLEGGQWAEARARQLHDDRFNRAFDAAIRRADGYTPLLSEAQIDRMVANYRASWVNLRAENFARTEASRAIHQGQDDLYRQAIDDGELRAHDLECTWHAGAPPRTRAWHATMNGQTRPWGKPFHSGQGNLLMYPCDDDAPADEVCSCRCARSVRVKRSA